MRPRAKKLLLTGIVASLSFVLGFLVLEAYLRLSRRTVDLYVVTGRLAAPNPMREWAVLDAFAAYRARPGAHGAGKTVNRHGFMSTPEIETAKPPDTVRLLFLGGSSTAGTGVNLKDSETWPWKTAEMVRERTGRKVDFINGAAGGYTTFESYGRLWSRLRHFAPDFVVVYHGWNDMYYFDKADEIVAWRTLPDGSWSFDQPRKMQRYTPYRLDPLLRWSQVLTRVRLAWTQRFDSAEDAGNSPPASGIDPRALEIFRTHLRLFETTCEVIGARLLVAKQATLVVPGASPAQRERCGYSDHAYDVYADNFRQIYSVIDQELPAGSVIDVTPVSGRLEFFHDHIHPSPRGTTEIARIMADALVPLVGKKE